MEELVRVPFLENPNWGYLWINSPKVHTICFYCIPGWTLSNILTLRCSPLSYTSYKADFKSKKFPELVSLPHFLYFFKENCISKYSIDQISLSGCLYFVKYGTCIVIVCQSGCDVINFENNRILLIKLSFLDDWKDRNSNENLNILTTKRAFKVILRWSFLMDFHWSK